MLDAHVHIERGEYSWAWIQQFIQKAQNEGITELYLLEHSHRFREFYDLYAEIAGHPVWGAYQKTWLKRRCQLSLRQYQEFITAMRQQSFPLAVSWGLEICYFPGQESLIRQVVADFPWDFLTGAIHWIRVWGFDHPQTQEYCRSQSVDAVYAEYYQLMLALVNSGLFTIVAHPDSIKCFHYYPTRAFTAVYTDLAHALARTQMKAEFSAGLKINYQHPALGLNHELLQVLLDRQVELVTASDAHRPEDVGKYLQAARQFLQARGPKQQK
jgi:histidinol-phosphatase (PHP family)